MRILPVLSEIEKLDVTEHVKNWRQFQVSIISYYSRKPGLFIFFQIKGIATPGLYAYLIPVPAI
ncbi:Uncharacterised protein [Klebsiella pneumoniae]|uniref:hypothetical protein n=1 Tax=Klebsiella pneumoniae TaxID=573 RepID=UPI000E2C9858|nr:hypothetical protein [Klebsiella pneumoniae]SXT02569.1 Uncharacterised protein [Klebsiella pneumoniae]